MEKEKSGHLVWIDISKGVAMLLVLLGHSMRDEMRMASPVLDVIYRSIYMFHMTWFFWLSGYGYRLSRNNGRKPLQISGKRIRTQFPYWILYTLFIYAAFSVATSVPALRTTLAGAGYSSMSISSYLLSSIQANNPWAYHLWFLLVLIIITLIVSIADSVSDGRNTNLVCICLIALGIAGLSVRDSLYLGKWWRLYDYITLYLPAFCLGILMEDMKVSDTFAWIWGILGLVYIIVRVKFFSDFSGNSLRVNGWTRFSVYLAGDLLLPGLMVLLGRLFEKGYFPFSEYGRRFFNFLGRESLSIYLWHQPFCCAFLGMILYKKLRVPALLVMSVCIVVSLGVSMAAVYLKRKLEKSLIRKDS